MNETVQSLQRVIKTKNKIIDQLVEDKLEAQKAMTRFEMKQDDLERRLLALESKQERIDREVSKFERLNNANEWVKP